MSVAKFRNVSLPRFYQPKDCRLWDIIQVYLTTRQYAMLTKDIQQSKCYYFLRTRDEFVAHFES